MLKITNEMRTALAKVVPGGSDLGLLRMVPGRGQVRSAADLSDAESAVLADATKQAGVDPIGPDGKPAILRISAWMCHALPSVNLNRAAFVGEELQALSYTLFRAPQFGLIDVNHAAVRSWSTDEKMVGVWTKADWAFDQQALDGKGCWGLLASGVVFSWAFPEVATMLLGEQARHGSVAVSMTCLPSTIEYRSDADGEFELLHNPVYFAVAVLDVPPADPDSLGAVTEDPSISDETLRTRIAQVEESVMEEEIVVPAEVVVETLAPVVEEPAPATPETVVEALVVEAPVVETVVEAPVVEPVVESADLTAKLADAETRLLELATVRDTLKASLDIAGQMITQLTDKIAEQEAELATFRATVIETARLDRLQARLAELPAEFRKTHDAREAEAKARVEARWAGLTDAEWQDTRADLVAYLPVKIGYALRSDLEGQHLGGGDDTGSRLDSLLAATRK